MQRVSPPRPLVHTVFTATFKTKRTPQDLQMWEKKTKENIKNRSPLIRDQKWPPFTKSTHHVSVSSWGHRQPVTPGWAPGLGGSYCHSCLTRRQFYLKCKHPKKLRGKRRWATERKTQLEGVFQWLWPSWQFWDERERKKSIRGSGPESPRCKGLQAEGPMSPQQLRHRCWTRPSSE